MSKWILKPIKNICIMGRGRVISQLELIDNGAYPVYSSQSFNNGEMGRINTYDFDGEYVTWTTDGAYAGTVFLRSGKFNCTNVCGTLKSLGEIDMLYLSYKLGTIAKSYVSYVGNPKLMNNIVAKIHVEFPISITEQRKIAEVLSTIDETIEKTTALIEKYTAIKKGLIQDSLNRGKRHTVKNCFTLRARIGWQGLRSDEFIEEGAFLVTGMDFDNCKIDWDNCYHVAEWRYKQDLGIQIHDGDLLITKDGTIGKTAFVENCPQKTTLNSGVFVVRPKNNNVLPKYLFYVLNSHLFELFMSNILTGSTIKHLNQEHFYKFSFRAPDIEEQKSIVEQLTQADYIITTERNYLTKLLNIKKGLMHDLLTNKKSVEVLLNGEAV